MSTATSILPDPSVPTWKIYDLFRDSPVFQQALGTRSVIAMGSAKALRKRDLHLYYDVQIRDAALRLDHLIRGALNAMYWRYQPDPKRLSAIKLFVEMIDEKMQGRSTATVPPRYDRVKPLLPRTHEIIGKRLEFCRDLIKITDALYERGGYAPMLSLGFRQFLLENKKCCWGIWANSISDVDWLDSIVFKNPFAFKDSINIPSHAAGFWNSLHYYWN